MRRCGVDEEGKASQATSYAPIRSSSVSNAKPSRKRRSNARAAAYQASTGTIAENEPEPSVVGDPEPSVVGGDGQGGGEYTPLGQHLSQAPRRFSRQVARGLGGGGHAMFAAERDEAVRSGGGGRCAIGPAPDAREEVRRRA